MIEKIFNNSKVNKNKLLNYGFKIVNNNYIYSINIMRDNFRIDVIIENEKINSKIYDLNFNEEYTNINIRDNNYANLVRNKYEELLYDIKNKCFDNYYFESAQANRIAKYIIDKYKDKPEFLWETSPKHGVFRNKNNNKWYAIIMNLKGVEIINVKVNEEDLKKLLKINGYKEAYHMNKKKWITIILNDILSDKEIKERIDYSYNIINNISIAKYKY